MIAHASNALLSKISRCSSATARTFSSMHWSSSSHVGDAALHRPLSSLQEALYPSDHFVEPEDPRDDPCRYGYRFVYPGQIGSMNHHAASTFNEDGSIGMNNRTTEDFMQETIPNSNESYYNASFRPEIVNETSAPNALERAAFMDSHRDWDRQLLEEEMLRFVSTD
ncbi:hypothetical protein MPSEU_000246600 [Mayamaea pseudoterrestris]|nr:hypothetical protein MPSEU_000246600 [Mayamaea pseudoterrestris]